MTTNFKAEDFEYLLDDYDKAMLKCLKENLGNYLPSTETEEDINYWINRVRNNMILEEIQKVFIMQNW